MAKLKEEFLVFFIEEVQDILDRLEQIMINFEHTTLDEELNRSIKRDFHTLKGDFLTYNFKKYSEYFHKVEDLWEIEEFRPFTAETILKNITEVRIFLKITQNSGLEDAFTFEEKSQMLEELNEENLKNAKNENPKELLLKTNEEKKSEVDTLFSDTTTDIIPNTSNSDNDTHYTFTLNFREDDDLKIEVMEKISKKFKALQTAYQNTEQKLVDKLIVCNLMGDTQDGDLVAFYDSRFEPCDMQTASIMTIAGIIDEQTGETNLKAINALKKWLLA